MRLVYPLLLMLVAISTVAIADQYDLNPPPPAGTGAGTAFYAVDLAVIEPGIGGVMPLDNFPIDYPAGIVSSAIAEVVGVLAPTTRLQELTLDFGAGGPITRQLGTTNISITLRVSRLTLHVRDAQGIMGQVKIGSGKAPFLYDDQQLNFSGEVDLLGQTVPFEIREESIDIGLEGISDGTPDFDAPTAGEIRLFTTRLRTDPVDIGMVDGLLVRVRLRNLELNGAQFFAPEPSARSLWATAVLAIAIVRRWARPASRQKHRFMHR